MFCIFQFYTKSRAFYSPGFSVHKKRGCCKYLQQPLAFGEIKKFFTKSRKIALLGEVKNMLVSMAFFFQIRQESCLAVGASAEIKEDPA